MTKIIAMYLPQFHRTPENDMWWGNGFTEWTAVKSAEQIFEGQYQPRKPLNENYYNLLEKKTMIWQAELMHKYGVDGMCFYHYYFKEGRKILEKPAENLLNWKDIDMPFCFSWANETWARSWSRLSNVNSWTSKFEKQDEKSNILLEQSYGEEEQWKLHFEYLLPFFKDKRYIKIDGKPVFIFYRPQSIPCLVRMIDYWRKLSAKEGLRGLFLIGTNMAYAGTLDAVMLQEPQYSLTDFEKKSCIDVKEIWEHSIKCGGPQNQKTFYCGFPGYDDTPRRGNGGLFLKGSTPNLFKQSLIRLLRKSEYYGNELTFINAWNEWGEGMYLEPDERYGYRYLQALLDAKNQYKNTEYELEYIEKNNENLQLIDRYRSYWTLFDRWLYKLELGCKLEDYFKRRNIKNIAIYGLGMIGKHFINEIRDSVNIKYAIDRRSGNINMSFPVVSEVIKEIEVDAIVVTVSYDYPQIYKELKKNTQSKILLIDEVVEEC